MSDEVDDLKWMITQLHAEIAELRAKLIAHADQTSRDFRRLNGLYRGAQDHLIPIIEKLFPGYDRAKQQLSDILVKTSKHQPPMGPLGGND